MRVNARHEREENQSALVDGRWSKTNEMMQKADIDDMRADEN